MLRKLEIKEWRIHNLEQEIHDVEKFIASEFNTQSDIANEFKNI